MSDTSTYVAECVAYQKRTNHAAPPWLKEIRKTGIDRFAAAGFPTAKDESWRFTRVRPLLGHQFALQEDYKSNGHATDLMKRATLHDLECRRTVFVNGNYADELSSRDELPEGAWIGSLREAIEAKPDLVEEHLAKHSSADETPFLALNTAYIQDGAFVYIPRGCVIDDPIHLQFITKVNGTQPVSHPRNLVVVEEGAKAVLVESFVGDDKSAYFTNLATELVVGRDAQLDHIKVQKEGSEAFHMASLHATVERNGRFKTDSITLGGTLVRNDVSAVLSGVGIDCTMNGLYVATGHQHVDNHTIIEHAKPECESHELYKGILNGRARAVFNGKIHVHTDAQKTDARQSNGCMLLSDDAQINTNPQLEIYADDVKCTHGAVVGQIEEDAVFYLRSRGIGERDARHMLIYAFANDVVDRITLAPIREILASELFEWLAKAK